MGVSPLGVSTDGIVSGAGSGWTAAWISLGAQRRKSCVSPSVKSVDMVVVSASVTPNDQLPLAPTMLTRRPYVVQRKLAPSPKSATPPLMKPK